MASIVQSIHMSAKASVAKTESLKRQRSVKSVSRTSNVTFASIEETVDRRHAMSLFAVRKREMLFFLFFCLQFGCKTLLSSSSARDDDASRVRFERAQTRPRCERSIDPTDAYSRATTKSSKQYAFRFWEKRGLKSSSWSKSFALECVLLLLREFLGAKTRFYLSYPPISSLGESSL